MHPTATRFLHILVPVKRCDGYDGGCSNPEALTKGPLFLQVRRLCSQNPRQPSTDGNRHECEALYGAPVVFLFGTKNSYMPPSLARFTRPSHHNSFMIMINHQNRTLSTRLVRNHAPLLPFLGDEM